MSPLDISKSIAMASDADFDRWLNAHGGGEREVVVAIYKKASGQRTARRLLEERRMTAAGIAALPGDL